MGKKIAGALDKGAGIASKYLRYLCMALLFFMMLWGTVDVTGRYIFNKPLYGTVEVFGMLLPAIVLLGLAYTQYLQANIRMEILISRVSPRALAILSLFTTLCMLFIAVLVLWRGVVLVITYQQINFRIATIGVPLYLPQMLVPLGSLLLCFVLIIQLLQYSLQLGERS